MIVLAMDPGVTNIGYAVLKKEGERIQLLDWGCWNFKSTLEGFNNQMNDVLNQVYNGLKLLISHNRVTHVAWEIVPGFGGMSHQSKIITMVTALKCLSIQFQIPWTHYSPISVKKKATNLSKATKAEVKRWVITQYPDTDVKGIPYDVYDAIMIGWVSLNDNQWTTPTGTGVE